MKKLNLFRLILLTSSVCSGFVIQPKLNGIARQKKAVNNIITRYNRYNSLKLKMQQKSSENSRPISWSKEKGLQFFDIPATPEIWAIALVYFVQGLFGICRLALSFYYKDVLHLTPVDLSVISSISAIPWIIKPLYGFISDTFPLFGYKRKSYLVLSGLLGSVSWGLMAYLATIINNGEMPGDAVATVYSVGLVMMSSLGLAFSDVLVDAIVVGKSRDQGSAGALQSICWSSSSLGGILSAYFSGYFLQNYGTTFVFSLTSIIPLIMSGTAWLIEEKKIENFYKIDKFKFSAVCNSLKMQGKHIFDALTQKSILYPFIFLIIWNATPTAGSALFYFEVNKLGFQPEFFGKLGLISSISSLFGIVLYNQKLREVPLRTILKWSCIVGTFLGMTPIMLVTHINREIGIPDAWFAILDDIVLSVFGQITFMPILVLAAKMCPVGVEAMLYATIMSANNLSGNIGRLLGGGLTGMLGVSSENFMNLPLLLLLTNLSGLIPLMFLKFIPDEGKNKEGDGQ